MGVAKIVLVGAGSTSFGVNMLSDLVGQQQHLHGSQLALCDVDTARLARMTCLAERLNDASDAGFVISSATDYRDLLPGADFVVVSAEMDRLARWKLDWQIPFKYGVRHVLGENGGPGGLSHALRTVPLVLTVAREMERLSPNATLINFTNPLARVCLGVTRYTRVKTIGLCHQVNKGYYIVGRVLGLTPPVEGHFPPLAAVRALRDRIELQTTGLNHLTWIQTIRDRVTGQDLYPEFAERLEHFDPAFEPLSRRLFHAFGVYPTSGDGHLGEYFAYAHETSDLKGFDFDEYAAWGAELERRVDRAQASEAALSEFLSWQSGERGAHVIAAIVNNWKQYEEVVNVVNGGALPGLPDWAVVEIPAAIGANGAMPLHVPALPPAITALLNQQVAIQDRVVEAAVHGDRQAALQALLLDPVTSGFAGMEQMLDELLAVHADLLPTFRR